MSPYNRCGMDRCAYFVSSFSIELWCLYAQKCEFYSMMASKNTYDNGMQCALCDIYGHTHTCALLSSWFSWQLMQWSSFNLSDHEPELVGVKECLCLKHILRCTHQFSLHIYGRIAISEMKRTIIASFFRSVFEYVFEFYFFQVKDDEAKRSKWNVKNSYVLKNS